MLLTGLATAIRDAGLAVHEEPGWRTRTSHPAGMTGVAGIMLHHTAGPRTGNYPSLRTVRDGRPDVPGPLAQLGLARDGTVLIIAAGRANHSGKGSGFGLPKNDAARLLIGIEAESTGVGGNWTPAQLDAYPRLVAALCRYYNVPVSKVIGHKEWAPGRKIDPEGWPGGLDGFRRSVATILGQKYRPARAKVWTTLAAIAAAIGVSVSSLVALNPGTSPTDSVTPGQVIQVPNDAVIEPSDPVEIAPPPPAPAQPAPPAPTTGATSSSASRHQEQLNALGYGLVVDGVPGPKTRAATADVQRRCGIAQDGVYGPATTRCVNNLIAAKAQGSASVVRFGDRGQKVVALQERLNRLGYGLRVDGSAGNATVGAVEDIQRRCGLVVDRVAGPYTNGCIDRLAKSRTLTRVLDVGDRGDDVRALQAKVGAKVDGAFGWETYGKVLKFQRAHGLRRDGHVGPATARALGWTWRG